MERNPQPRLPRVVLVGLAALLAGAAGCIDERCREDRDCPGVRICNEASGSCVYECTTDAECGGGDFRCVGHRCEFWCGDAVLVCPPAMTSICGSFCIDTYEASRPDATATHGGSDESQAVSRAGVLPWFSTLLTPAAAATACAAAGKRLCTPQEWEVACAGVDELTYCYGFDYDPLICNSIDTFCDEECGVYPECSHDCPYELRVLPTGALATCRSPFGVYDLSGNVWETVSSDDGADHFRGGAYNCGDPGLAHKCGYDGVAAGSFPTARGFRCCADGEQP